MVRATPASVTTHTFSGPMRTATTGPSAAASSSQRNRSASNMRSAKFSSRRANRGYDSDHASPRRECGCDLVNHLCDSTGDPTMRHRPLLVGGGCLHDPRPPEKDVVRRTWPRSAAVPRADRATVDRQQHEPGQEDHRRDRGEREPEAGIRIATREDRSGWSLIHERVVVLAALPIPTRSPAEPLQPAVAATGSRPSNTFPARIRQPQLLRRSRSCSFTLCSIGGSCFESGDVHRSVCGPVIPSPRNE